LRKSEKSILLPDFLTKHKMNVTTERKKFAFEYIINASPEFLYTYISTASGLAGWFADDVKINGDIYTFMWEGSEEKARLVNKRMNKFVKFQWLAREGEYMTIEINMDDLTGDVALVITDFENENELHEARMIYDVSLDRLKQMIGG